MNKEFSRYNLPLRATKSGPAIAETTALNLIRGLHFADRQSHQSPDNRDRKCQVPEKKERNEDAAENRYEFVHRLIPSEPLLWKIIWKSDDLPIS
ncbi:MAG TPA: hypothetical protein VFL79_18580 [Terriglobia bacterium]|nr:hypothetical protein [Terriglobia bacterium]